jgi:drug/metabolite transporter (DMT)-like permease
VSIRATRLVQVSPEKMLFYQVAVSAVVLPLLSLGLGERWNWHWSAFAATSLALQTVVGAFASYLAWMWLLVHYPATRCRPSSFLTPIFALMAGALWLHEPITARLMAALALVALGIVLVNRAGRRGRATEPLNRRGAGSPFSGSSQIGLWRACGKRQKLSKIY